MRHFGQNKASDFWSRTTQSLVEFLCYVMSLFGAVEGMSILSAKAFAFMSVFRAGGVNDM